jgi:hypothetical protein
MDGEAAARSAAQRHLIEGNPWSDDLFRIMEDLSAAEYDFRQDGTVVLYEVETGKEGPTLKWRVDGDFLIVGNHPSVSMMLRHSPSLQTIRATRSVHRHAERSLHPA